MTKRRKWKKRRSKKLLPNKGRKRKKIDRDNLHSKLKKEKCRNKKPRESNLSRSLKGLASSEKTSKEMTTMKGANLNPLTNSQTS